MDNRVIYKHFKFDLVSNDTYLDSPLDYKTDSSTTLHFHIMCVLQGSQRGSYKCFMLSALSMCKIHQTKGTKRETVKTQPIIQM